MTAGHVIRPEFNNECGCPDCIDEAMEALDLRLDKSKMRYATLIAAMLKMKFATCIEDVWELAKKTLEEVGE